MNSKLLKASMISLATVAVLSMTGCGSDDSSSNNDNSGKAVDGYISGAKVYLDIDNNSYDDDVDPSDTTKAGGVYHLNISDKEKDDALSAKSLIKVDNSANYAIDEDTGKSFQGRMSAPYDGKDAIISPLSSIAAGYYRNNRSATSDDAYNKVAEVFGFGDKNGTFIRNTDPVELAQEHNDSTLLAKNMVLHHLAVAKQGGVDSNFATNLFSKLYDTNGSLKASLNITKDTSVADLLVKDGNLNPVANIDSKLVNIYKNMETAIINVTKKSDGNYSKIEDAAKILAKVDANKADNLKLGLLESVAKLAAQDVNNLVSFVDAVQNMDKNTTTYKALITKVQTEMNTQGFVPEMSFAAVKLTDNNTSSNSLVKITSAGDFNQSIQVKGASASADRNITNFALELNNVNIDPITEGNKTSGNLKVLLTNAANGNEYNVTIPMAIYSANGANANLTIASGTKITLDTNDTTKSGAKEVNFTLKDDYNKTSLTFDMNVLYDDMNTTEKNNFDNNLTYLVKKDVNYSMVIKLTDFNSSKLTITPATVKGDFNLTH